MAVYTLVFVAPGDAIQDLAGYASGPEAGLGGTLMMKRKATPSDVEVFVWRRRIRGALVRKPSPVAQPAPANAEAPNFAAPVDARRAAAELAGDMAINDPDGLEMLAAELLIAGAACEDAFGWTPAFYGDVAAQLRRRALRSRNYG